MLINLCLHSHNFYCDGSSHPLEYLESAVNKGFVQYAFSSHAPLKISTPWSMKLEKLNEYSQIIDDLKVQYKDKIDVFKSLEIDFIPDDTYNFEFFKENINLDFTIGSIHLVKNPQNGKIWFIDGPQSGYDKGLNDVFDGDIKAAVTQYFLQSIDMIKSQKPDILGHCDKVLMNNGNRFFTSDDPWYLDLLDALLHTAKQENCIVEINTRGLYKGRWQDAFPGKYAWKRIKNLGLPIILSSDAHKPSEIDGYYDEIRQELKSFGFSYQMMRKGKEWVKIDI